MRSVRWCRKAVIVTLIGLVAFGVAALVAWCLTSDPARAGVRREMARIKAAGETVKWEDFIPRPVPDADNAALIYQQAFPLLAESGPDTENLMVLALEEVPPLTFDPQWFMSRGMFPYLEPMVWEAARTRVARNRAALDLCRRASAMDRCVFPVDYAADVVLLPHLMPLRSAERLLVVSARVRSHDGDVRGAWDDLLAAIRVERATRLPTCLACYAAGSGMLSQALGNGLAPLLKEPGAHPTEWGRLLDELGTADRQPLLMAAMHGERADHLRYFDLFRGDVSACQRCAPPRLSDDPVRFLFRAPDLRDKAGTLQVMTEFVRLTRLPAWEAIAEARKVRVENAEWAEWTQFAASCTTGIFVKHATYETDLALARVALALKLYKHGQGAYPKTLDGLAPGVLKAVPPDPFTGRPLIYRRRDDGFLVYSVGEDLVDNGGRRQPYPASRPAAASDIVWECDQ